MATGPDSALLPIIVGDPTAAPLATLRAHLSVAQPDLAVVQAACDALSAALDAVPSRTQAALAELGGLLRRQRNAAAPVVFACLLREAERAPDATALFALLLGAARTELVTAALRALPERLARGAVRADVPIAAALEVLAARAGAAIGADLHAAADALVRTLAAELTLEDPAGLLASAYPAPVRALAARVLDAAGAPAAAAHARALLGDVAYAQLAPYLTFTRATYRELVALTPAGGARCPCAAAVRAAQSALGERALGEALAELRWESVARGLEVETVVALAVDGGLPLLVRPAEAELLERCMPCRRAWHAHVITAFGSAAEAAPDAGESDAEAVRRFRRSNLQHAELLAEILEVAPVTNRKLRRILDLLDDVTRDFAMLFRAQDPEAASVADVYRRLRAPFAKALETGEPDALVPAELARQVQRFEDPPSIAAVQTLHGLKRWLHQRGLRNALQRFRGAAQAERTVDLLLVRADEPPRLVRRIRYAELEPQATSGPVPTAVRLLARAFQRHLLHGGTTFPSVLALLYGAEVQVYVQYRNHPAFLRLDLSPPGRGGMIDLEYYAVSQYELAQHPDRDVPAIRTLLRRLGFHVELQGVRLHARYDKEAALDLGDILEHAGALCGALPHLMDLDWTVGSLQYSRAARENVAAGWAEIFLRLGALPVARLLTADRCHAIDRAERDALGERTIAWDGRSSYHGPALATLPIELPDALRDELRHRGLAAITGSTAGVRTQCALERAVLEPLRAAAERGEVREVHGRLEAVARARFVREHEADRLARLLIAGGPPLRAAAALAGRLRSLERQLQLRVTGTIEGWSVERASLHVGGEPVALALLRDEEGVPRLASVARDGVWYRVRTGRARAWRDGGALDPGIVLRRLLADNYLAPDRELRLEASVGAPGRLLAEVRASRGGGAAYERGDERRIPGTAGAAGRATGPVCIRTSDAPRGLEGGVLTAPDIGPADAPLLRPAAAVLTTGGGILSHIGLLALELGRPALVVRGSWPAAADASPVLALPRLEYRPEAHELEGLRVVRRSALAERIEHVRDGDLVVVDADASELRLLGSDRSALALHEGLSALSAVLDPAAARADADALVVRGELIRILHQLEKTIGRLARPELAEHLVTELGLGPLATLATALPHRERLLACLDGNAQVRDAARAARERLGARLRRAAESAAAELREALTCCSPLELLQLRLAARRAHAQLREATRGQIRRPGQAVDPELEQLLVARLRTMREDALATAAALPAGSEWRLRHLLERAVAIGAVLPRDEPAQVAALAAQVAAGAQRARAANAEALLVPAASAGLELAREIGFKAANLGECARILGAGAVPGWFALTDHAFRAGLSARFGGGRTLADEIRVALRGAAPRCAEEWQQLAAEIRSLWCDVALPPALVDAILSGYRTLAGDGSLPYLAVRSSTWEEDTPDAAWAGQFDTYLCVQGDAALLRHVRLAWAGLWSVRALQHRAGGDGAPGGVGGGVIVQRMVDARVAGVVQTVRAAAGRMRELVIDVALGLGEGVVSGTVEVDEIRVHKPAVPGGALRLQYRVGDKRECIRFDAVRGTGTRREETRFHERLRPALEYGEVEDLVSAVLALEHAYGHPLEIEFAFEGPAPLILQARPIPLFRAALRETVACAPLLMAGGIPEPELSR